MTIYRNFDRAALDTAYNNSGAVPDAEAIIARWVAAGEAMAAAPEARLDLAYGPGPRQSLDLFVPAGEGPFPVFAFIHGGYWQRLNKRPFACFAPAFLEAGIAYAAIGYPLCPEVRLTELVESVRRGVAWLGTEGSAHGLDPERVHIGGHSAGGHLTAMMMSTDWAARGLPADLVKSGCAISGVYDLEPIRLGALHDAVRLDEGEVAALSPIHTLPARAEHLTLCVGGDELPEFLRQQAEYGAAWRAKGLPLDEMIAEGDNHFTVINALGEPGSPLYRAIAGQILR
jgi:arylformamidase